MHRGVPESRSYPCCRKVMVCLAVVGLILVALPVHAAVTFDSQFRDVTAFTNITIPNGDPIFCTDQVVSHDPGVFAETIDCLVEEAGSQASALAGQLSYIFPEFFIAEGSFDAHA